MSTWPKYFIASEPPQSLAPPAQYAPRFALDVFRASLPLEFAPGASADDKHARAGDDSQLSEWIVTTDATAQLRLLPGSCRKQLSTEVQHQINMRELLSPLRILRLKQLFLFDLEYVEARGNPPGLNDPVQLHGRLFGPFPSASSQSAPGQLTVTRADILEGLLRGRPFAFQYADERVASATPQCLHLLLPGATAAELESGQGAILAFPLLGSALATGHPCNQGLTAGLLYDLLGQLQADFLHENIQGAFPELKLPVPNRRLHEARLKASGHEIQGNAVYPPISKSSRTWLGRLFERLLRERKTLPPEGTLCDFMRLARVALSSLPGWPDLRARTVQGLSAFPALSWSIDNDTLLRPLSVTTDSMTGAFALTAKELISPRKPAQRYLCFQVDRAFPFRQNAAFDIQVEYQGSGELCVVCGCIDASAEQALQWSASVPLETSAGWHTATFSLRGAGLRRGLWSGADFALRIQSPKEFRLRRVSLAGRGQLALSDPPQTASAPRSEPQALRMRGPARGSLDVLGRWHQSWMGRTLLFPRKPDFHLAARGWVADILGKSAAGAAYLVLKHDAGEFAFRVDQRRLARPDIVKHLGSDVYELAGFEGEFATEQVPAGEYEAFLRLVRPDGLSGVEVSSGRRVRFYDEPALTADWAAKICIEPSAPFWHWGLGEIPGYDRAFRIGVAASNEVCCRVWLNKGQAYLIAVGLMEPQYLEREQRILEVIVDGRSFGKYDLVAFPGNCRPHIAICPVSLSDSDRWVEVRVARDRASKGPDNNAVLFGLWVFSEGTQIDAEQVARGVWTDKALAYWPCGLVQQRIRDEVAKEVFARASLQAGKEGARISWNGALVAEARPPGDQAAVAAACFVEQQPQLPSFGFLPEKSPEQAQALLQRIRALPRYAAIAVAIAGSLPKAFAAELKDVLSACGVQIALPGADCTGQAQRNLIVLGIKGLAPSYALELDGPERQCYPAPAPEAAGLVGHWWLNEGSGQKIVDASGRGHHGLLKGCKWTETLAGPLLEFDGSGYITVPCHKDFDIQGDMALTLWMCPELIPDRHMLVAGRADPQRPYLIWWYKNEFTFIQCNRHWQCVSWAGRQPYPPGKWMHVTAVVSGREAVFYIDGAEIRRAWRTGVPSNSSAPFTIGGFENNWHPHFRGRIQDVRLYNRALSSDEILKIMAELRPDRLAVKPKRPRRKPKSK